ncbi:hypothetical protein A2U01_0112348, partial [Trifolium medium]|nr:hypothetical protein [Trifolium medium]
VSDSDSWDEDIVIVDEPIVTKPHVKQIAISNDTELAQQEGLDSIPTEAIPATAQVEDAHEPHNNSSADAA